MKLKTILFAFSALAALPVQAGEPLSAEAFDRLTQGRTLYYFSNGSAYGVEQYRPNRRVTWSFLDGQCQEGSWYQEGDFICFDYFSGQGPQCWKFFMEGSQLRAVFGDGSQDSSPYVADEAPEDMTCLGPKVGV